MPSLWVIGGPNGAGKSTWAEKFIADDVPVISPDTIAAQSGVNPISAGKKALQERKALLKNRADFVVDTTFSGRGEVAHLRKALHSGYDVTLIFVGIKDPSFSAARVMQRVKNGGHNVPEEDIKRRFSRSVLNLYSVLKQVPDIKILDNSGRDYEEILTKERGSITFVSDRLPEWFLFPEGINKSPFPDEDQTPGAISSELSEILSGENKS